MIKFGLLLGVLVVGVVLIIAAVSGTSDGATPAKAGQAAKGSVSVGLLLGGIGVCVLSLAGMALMFWLWIRKPSETPTQPAPAPEKPSEEKKPEEKGSGG